jgi:hypothetical protein
MMRTIGATNVNQLGHKAKRVSVRSGGAGYAHSGVVRSEILSGKDAVADGLRPAGGVKSSKASYGKIVRLGR